MRRSLAVLIWILIGALAAGVGMSLALQRANQDRTSLARALQNANQRIQALEISLGENSGKSAVLTEELDRVQTELDRLRNWQTRLHNATPLTPLRPAQTKGWSEFASVPLGVSIRVPPGMQANTSDDGVFLKKFTNQHGLAIEEQWLGLSRYTPIRKQDIYTHSQMREATSVNYILGSRLFEGTKGMLDEPGQSLFLFSIQENATSTYLVWAKTVEGVSERTILDTLAMLSFK